MVRVNIDVSDKTGVIKPMHSVNNGPVGGKSSNVEAYRAAGIPYARTHDSSFNAGYGGEHTIDVHLIFTNFDADEYDEKSYDFTVTDNYIKEIMSVGTKVFYRLGSKIEHGIKKYGTVVPKDYHKWAVICEHIIRHYNYGWADGFHYNIEYFEIWNEADLGAGNIKNPCWQGTEEQFFEFFNVAANHLKSCFPELKIGGPALAFWKHTDWVNGFFNRLTAPIDFFSWHMYSDDPSKVASRIRDIRAYLDAHGLAKAESILNEWNYVKAWTGENWHYSLETEKNLKGSAYISSVMLESQNAPLDHLMFYDARPCSMNSMFNTDMPCKKLKGYYPFPMFNSLYCLKNAVSATSDDADVRVAAANNENRSAIMLSHFNDDESTAEKEVSVHVRGDHAGTKKASVYMLDDVNNCKLTKEEVFTSDEYTIVLNMPLYSTCLIKIECE